MFFSFYLSTLRLYHDAMKKFLTPKKSGIHGKGLFTQKLIKEGDIVGICKTRKTRRPGDHTLWTDSGPIDVVCDLKYINHHPSPNVAYYDDLTVVALRDIKAGEELTHHYGDEWE